MVNSLTVMCPGPVAAKQAQIILYPTTMLTLHLVVFVMIILQFVQKHHCKAKLCCRVLLREKFCFVF